MQTQSPNRFIPPAEREDDLCEWEHENDVDKRIADLPAKFGIKETDLGLAGGTAGLVRQFLQPENKTLAAEAKRKLSKLQLLVLNLMLYSSGYRDDPVTAEVKKWPSQLLVGDDMQLTNFGNYPLQSRQSDDNRHASPVSPGEGWLYRMIDFKENFFKVLKSLNYYTPKPGVDADRAHAEVMGRREVEFAHRLLKQLKIEAVEAEAPAQA